MIRLEVTGDTVEEFGTNFARVIAVFAPFVKNGVQQMRDAAAKNTTPVEDAPPTQPEKPEPIEGEIIPPKKEAKPPKEKAKPKQTDIEDAIKEAKPPSVGDVREKLMALSKSKGDDVVWELLGEFGVKKASDIPDDKRAEVIAKIDGLLA